MKRLFLALSGLSVVIGLGFLVAWAGTSSVAHMDTAVESTPVQAAAEPQPMAPAAVPAPPEPVKVETIAAAPPTKRATQAPAAATKVSGGSLNESVDTLVSTQTAYQEKQKIWKDLLTAGRMDDAIAELERRKAGDPQSSANSTALGQAYLKKGSEEKDFRQQAILAMKADEAFEGALAIDPANWEARFTKTVAMSHWPADLKKGDEVAEQFGMLIEQQEAQPLQPQFVQPYLRLGDFYEKSGNLESAAQIWHRGAALFPDDPQLKKRLAAAP